MDAIDIHELIAEVQNRSPIYNTNLKQYQDKRLKKKLWNQIGEAVYTPPVWAELSSTEKIKYVKELKKKWSSLRRSFRRELFLQRTTPGIAGKKRRKYFYFDSLLFLAPFTTSEDYESSIEGSSTEDKKCLKRTRERSTPKIKVKLEATKVYCQDEVIPQAQEGDELGLNKSSHTVTEVNKIEDEDEAFLKSLLPSLKELKKDDKLLLRIEIMKTVVNFKKSLSSVS